MLPGAEGGWTPLPLGSEEFHMSRHNRRGRRVGFTSCRLPGNDCDAEHVGQLCMAAATVLIRRPSNFRSRHEFLVVADDSTDLGQKGRNVCWLRDAISHCKTHAVYAIPVRSTRWVISTYWFVSIDRPGTPGQTLQDTIAMLYAFLQRRGQLNKRTCLINVR